MIIQPRNLVAVVGDFLTIQLTCALILFVFERILEHHLTTRDALDRLDVVHHAFAVLTGRAVGPVGIEVVHIAIEGLGHILHPVDHLVGGGGGIGVAVEGPNSLGGQGIDRGQPAGKSGWTPGPLQLKEGPELVKALLEASAAHDPPVVYERP